MEKTCYEDDKDVIYILWPGPTAVNATITTESDTDLLGFTIQYGSTGNIKKITTSLSAGTIDLGSCTDISMFISGYPESTGHIGFTLTMSNDYGSKTEEISIDVLQSIDRVPYTPGPMARIVAEIETRFGDNPYWRGVDYLDLTMLQVQGGEVTATVAENQGGSASFTLLNDLDGQNLLSDSLTWHKGTVQKLVPGIYVKIDLIDKGQYLGRITDGFISTISADEDKITMEIGDGNAFLGKQGTSLRRNYYNRDSTLSYLLPIGVETVDSVTRYYASIKGIEGTPLVNTLMWSRILSKDTGTDTYIGRELSKISKIVLPIPSEAVNLRSIGLKVIWYRNYMSGDIKAHLRVICGQDILADADASAYAEGWNDGLLTVSLDWSKALSSSTLEIYVTDMNRAQARLRDHDSSEGGHVIYNGNQFSWEPYYVISYSKWESVSGATLDGTKIIVTSSSDNEWMAPESGSTQEGRAKIDIVSGNISTLEIMDDIAGHFGTATHESLSCTSWVGMFCIGGGYALDYLQKASDIPDDNGRKRTFLRTGFGQNKKVIIGDRYDVKDTAVSRYSYGDVEGCTPFVSFSPHLTIKGRPKVVTLRSTSTSTGSSTAKSLITTVSKTAGTAWPKYTTDDTLRFERTESAVSVNSVNEVRDAVIQAYGEMTSAELDEWEGEMVLPGIVLDLIRTSGQYAGSGIPITVTDSRYSMTDYAARIREVSYDLNAMTTTVTLNNYSMVYSGQISDTVALAVTGASQAFAAGDSTFFNTQYVFIESDDIAYNIVGKYLRARIKKADGSTTVVSMDGADVGILPDGRYIVQSEFVSDIDDVADYGVVGIKYNPKENITPAIPVYDIPENLRPDAKKGQRVIVCIITSTVVGL